MAAEPTNTWDLVPARRPSLEDMGGAKLKDDAKSPPDPETMPTAASLNQCQYQPPALASVSPSFILDIVNSGAASISRLTACGTNIEAATFTVTRTGAGTVEITWAAGTFPVSVAHSFAQMTADGAWFQPVVIDITNGVRIKTRDSSSNLTDGDFTVYFY